MCITLEPKFAESLNLSHYAYAPKPTLADFEGTCGTSKATSRLLATPAAPRRVNPAWAPCSELPYIDPADDTGFWVCCVFEAMGQTLDPLP